MGCRPGTLASVEQGKQDGLGKGVWKDGVWRTVISVPRDQEKFTLSVARQSRWPSLPGTAPNGNAGAWWCWE